MYFLCRNKGKSIIRILSFSILIFYVLVSCTEDKREYTHLAFNPETIPSLKTDSLTMLISDSGIIRYRVTADAQMVFDKSKDPHYLFPKGVYVEQLDTNQHVIATLRADTAWNFLNRKMWQLKGNVFIRNIRNETFSSEEVFWDERNQRVYSDKYIEINRPEKLLLKGDGFTSNQDMTDYRIFKPHDTYIYTNDEH